MALTTTQVNQAFLGLLGRPATGAEAAKFAGNLDVSALAATLLTDASFKNELSVETLSFKTVDLLNTDPAAFVESLYTALLGRASDAEGKAFWLSVAGATPNRADVVSQFIAAVQAQEGTADANAFASIQAEDKALASAWVESLYNNLAGRASDAEGLDFWTNAIVSFTMTPAQVAASFAAALALQGNTTEDGQNFAAKLGVADNFTASFKDFNSLVTANEKAEQLKNLVTMMNGVNKDSQVDQYTQEITKITDEYQKIAAVQFTAADDDNLGIDPETGESNLKGAANFTGTYNLTDAAKGTIQSSDSATGTEAYLTDTLTINVTGYDKTTHDTFDLGELPSTSSIEKLVINNGAATVSGNLGDFEYINVNGTGSFDITASAPDAETGLKDVSLNSAAKADNTFTATNTKVASFKSAAGNDTITLGEVSKSLNTGAGDDIVNASLGKGATADLGAGNDEFTGTLGEAAKLNAGAGDDTLTVSGTTNYKLDKNGIPVPDKNGDPIVNASIEIDGGTGDDTLDLSTLATDNGIVGNGLGIKSIRGIENIKIGTEATLTASAISGQKIELSGTNSKLNLKAENGVDLSKISKAANDTVDINVNSVKSGNVNLSVANTSANTIKETVTLAKDANKVSVKSFEKSYDKMAIDGVANVNGTAQLFSHNASGKAISFNVNVAQDTIYFVNLKDTVSKTSINNLLKDANKFADAMIGKSFYIVATDSTDVPADVTAAQGQGKNSTAKIYKVEVGKDGKVGKVDQMATVNVADKAQLSAVDFGANTTGGTISADITGIAADASGSLTLPAATLSDTTKAYSIDLSTNQDFVAGKVTSLSLTGAKAAALVIENKGTTPAKAVEVSVPAGADIATLTLGSATDKTQYNVTVTADAKISTIVTNNADNNIDISTLPAGTVKVVNAGEGIDTLKIGGEAAANGFSMTGVEKLAYTGTTINSDAIFANAEPNKTLELINESGNANKALIVKAGTANNGGDVDLSSLVNTEVAGKAAAIEVTGVLSGKTVTLSSGTAAITETVTLGAATNVTIANAAKGDNISSEKFAATVVGEGGKFADLGTGAIANTKAYFVNPTSAATVTDFATAKETFSAKLAAFTSGDAIIAVNGANDKVYVFAIKGATGGATATEVAIVNGQKFTAEFGIQDSTITIGQKAPIPVPTPGTLVAEKLTVGDFYKLSIEGAPLAIDKAGAELTVGREASYVLDQVKEIALNISGNGKVSFKDDITAANAVQFIDLQGSGDRTVELAKVNATAVKNITDGAANTTLDISSKTFDNTGAADKFAKKLSIDLGAGDADVVVLKGGANYASGDFTLAGVEGIKGGAGGAATLAAALVTTKDASGAYTSNIDQIGGELKLQAFDAAAKSIDLSKITQADTGSKLTIDVTGVTTTGLTSVKGTAATDTLLLESAASAGKDYSSITAITGIEKISLGAAGDETSGATIKFEAIKDSVKADAAGITLVSDGAGSGSFTITTGTETAIDLSKLANGTAAEAIAGVTLESVAANATVTLNANDKLAETIKLAATAAGVTINGFTTTAAKDIIKLGSLGVNAIDSDKIYDASANKIASLVANKLYYSSVAVDADGNNKLDAEFLGIITSAGLASGSSIYAAEVIGGTTKIYKMTSSSTSLATDDTVSLIATLDTALTYNGGNIIA